MKVFRKIRQKTLSVNKLGKYLTYAIGEIILVVIGILIALQINNWKEMKTEERVKSVFLQDFKSDLKTDIETLTYRIIENEQRLAAIDSISAILSVNKERSNKELIEFSNYHFILATESYFIPEKSTIRQFETSNKGNLILSKKIKNKLYKYYSITERIELNNEKSLQLYQHNFITKDIITPILDGLDGKVLGNVNEVESNSSNLKLSELKDNNDYFFALMIKKVNTIGQNNNYQFIIDKAEEIVDLLNTKSK